MRLHIKSLFPLLHLWFKIKINLFNILAAGWLEKISIPVLIYRKKMSSSKLILHISEKKLPIYWVL